MYFYNLYIQYTKLFNYIYIYLLFIYLLFIYLFIIYLFIIYLFIYILFVYLLNLKMSESGLLLVFLSFGVEGKGKGLTLNDLYGVYKFQIMTDKEDVLRGLKYAYGEKHLIERLSGTYNPSSNIKNTNDNNSDNSDKEDSDDDDGFDFDKLFGNNTNHSNDKKSSNYDSSSSSSRIDNKLINNSGNDIKDELKSMVEEIFYRFDKDKDKTLSINEFWDFSRYCGMVFVSIFIFVNHYH